LALAMPEGDTKSKKRLLRGTAVIGAVALIAILLLMATGCGSYSANHMNNMNNGSLNFLITGTSGTITHSTQVSLMVN
jgi:hypothetical protein